MAAGPDWTPGRLTQASYDLVRLCRNGLITRRSYDCVDRVVLNAFFPIGHNPGGFRCWLRGCTAATTSSMTRT